jgi:putative ABC transport system permease protein
MNDLRYALRLLWKTPGFTAVAVITLGLGIGACAAIFSVVNSVLLRPLPLPDPGRLVLIQETFPPTVSETTVASGRYLIWREQATSFASLGALSGMSYNLTGAGQPEHLYAARITASLLSTLGVQPALGRNFLPEEDALYGQETVAMLSHGLWQRRFGARREVIGQVVQLNGRPHAVVGVMPLDSALPDRVEVFTPMGLQAWWRGNFMGRSMQVHARLKPGITAAQAQSELTTVNERIAREHPEARGWGVKVTLLTEAVVGPVRPVLLSLLGAVGFLLLIVCANVASLLLARATARSREMAVRAAIGASRGRIVRQLLLESLLLAGLGGLLGVLIAEGGLSALLALAPRTLPRAGRIAVDVRALGFTLVLAAVTGAAFGLAPAFQAARVRLQETLKQGRGTGESGHRRRLRGALVVGEVAVAIWLLAGAGLLMRSFARLADVSPGFNPREAQAATVFLPRPQYTMPAEHVAFARQAMAEIAALPGVKAVAVAANIPFSDVHLTDTTATSRRFTIPGRPPASEADIPVSAWYTVSPDYFRAMGIPLLRGRAFEERDAAGTQGVAIISESVARRYFPGEDPLGKFIEIAGPGAREIVGIVGDVKARSLDGEAGLQTYQPFAQASDNDQVFVVRADRPIAIQAAIARVDPILPVYDARPITSFVEGSLARQRFTMTLFAVFSGVALLLAAIGIYGVMAYSVGQRTAEIGIRMALGAHSRQVMRLMLIQGGQLVGLGVVAGVVGALVLTRFLDRLLFEVGAHDPLTFAATVAVLALVAAVACALPARRAARVDPMVALRQE